MTRISTLCAIGAMALGAAVAATPAFAAGPNTEQAYDHDARSTWKQGESTVPASKAAAVLPDGMGVRPTDMAPASGNG